jgi:CRISPR-associated endonuclease/helicase Cas3
MLLSRALNRGYGMSRYRWPMHFGLLNNDCLWVLDETQLMGPGLSTACQLEAFRTVTPHGFGSCGGTGPVTWYMSATNSPSLLETSEWRGIDRLAGFWFSLSSEELAAKDGPIQQRRLSSKTLELRKDWSFADANAAKSLVDEIRKRHDEMLNAIGNDATLPARTLVICNTVDWAKEVHALLAAAKPDGCDLLLLHSRFRSPERREQMERLKNLDLAAFPRGQIVVSTQVIEAGVDVSSGILWSEVAPLASLVQRLGRLNRAGEFNGGKWEPKAFVVGVGVVASPPRESKDAKAKRESDNAKRCLPYDLPSCDPDAEASAWEVLRRLNNDASPASLEKIKDAIADSIPRCPYSLQRHELLDFFDTDANLSLGFTDVSPFVRGLDDDTDLQVLWRESWLQKDDEEGTGEPGFTPDFQRDELCPVPISKAKDPKAREVLNRGWLWRGKESGWVSVRDSDLAPGMTILLPQAAGGYDDVVGWTGDKAHNDHKSHDSAREWPSDEEQLSSLASGWQSIAVHTAVVEKQLGELLCHLLLTEEAERRALTLAVPWHDIGKNHPGWQNAVVAALERAGITGKESHQPFAKFSLSESPQVRNADGSSKFSGKQLYAVLKKIRRYFQPRKAHEVASALAFRQSEQVRLGCARDSDLSSLLAEYMIMSHHGRVRKVLRDEIPRFPRDDKNTNTVRGIADGSAIPPVEINGQPLGCDSLSTDCRKMGREMNADGTPGHESYTRGVLRLLEHYGPFRLAFFEAIFRAADIRASILAKQGP